MPKASRELSRWASRVAFLEAARALISARVVGFCSQKGGCGLIWIDFAPDVEASTHYLIPTQPVGQILLGLCIVGHF